MRRRPWHAHVSISAIDQLQRVTTDPGVPCRRPYCGCFCGHRQCKLYRDVAWRGIAGPPADGSTAIVPGANTDFLRSLLFCDQYIHGGCGSPGGSPPPGGSGSKSHRCHRFPSKEKPAIFSSRFGLEMTSLRRSGGDCGIFMILPIFYQFDRNW